jgi:hypothetical protein
MKMLRPRQPGSSGMNWSGAASSTLSWSFSLIFRDRPQKLVGVRDQLQVDVESGRAPAEEHGGGASRQEDVRGFGGRSGQLLEEGFYSWGIGFEPHTDTARVKLTGRRNREL